MRTLICFFCLFFTWHTTSEWHTMKRDNDILQSEARLLRDEITDLRFQISSRPTYEQGYHDGILQRSDVEAYTKGYHYAKSDEQ